MDSLRFENHQKNQNLETSFSWIVLWTVFDFCYRVLGLSAYHFYKLILDGPEIPDHPAQIRDHLEGHKEKAASSLLIFMDGPQISDRPAKIPNGPKPGSSGWSW